MIMMQPDWHSADIIAALKKRGTSLSAVSRNSGLASSTLANALTRRWPKGEYVGQITMMVPNSLSGMALFYCPQFFPPSGMKSSLVCRVVRMYRPARLCWGMTKRMIRHFYLHMRAEIPRQLQRREALLLYSHRPPVRWLVVLLLPGLVLI